MDFHAALRHSEPKVIHRMQSDDELVNNLLEAMSLEDKIAQMAQMDINALVEDDPDNPENKQLNQEKAVRFVGELGIGSVLNLVGNQGNKPWPASEYRKMAMQLQQIAKDHNRPPLIWGLDSVHGANYIRDATWTPSPLNLAATFNVSYATMAGQWASQDTRAAGITWVFSPLLGLAWNPSFARDYETFGEDPYLVGEFASAMIKGIEGADQRQGIIPSRAAASAKHFVGYPFPRDGHDRAPSWIPTRHLYQYFVLPWKKIMKETDIETVMESYTEADGVPNVANPHTTRYLLRQRLGFKGVLVTDYEEINNLNSWHHIVHEDENAVSKATEYALKMGTVDMSMVPWNIDGFLGAAKSAVQKGHIAESRIHESAKRVLRLKQRLGMFDEIMTASNGGETTSNEQQALDMAKDSLILTENKQSILPLKADAQGLKVLVTGPTANSKIAQTGGWTVTWQGPVDEEESFTTGETVYEALKAKVGKGVFSDAVYRCGTDILGGECNDPDGEDGGRARHMGFIDDVKDIGSDIGSTIGEVGSEIGDDINQGINDVGDWIDSLGHSSTSNHSSIDRAVESAKDVDLVVMCIGEPAYAEKPGDIRSPFLPFGQVELIQRMRDTYSDKPLVLVYFGGRPRLLQSMPSLSNAVIVAFLPGPHAGTAIASLLSGEFSPSGKLPITYPLANDGGGSPYFHAISDQCTKGDGPFPHYEYVPCSVQWPFGHGLSFVDFSYSNLQVEGNVLDGVSVQVDVVNKGSIAAAESVMVFTFDDFRKTTPEYKRLRAVTKVLLQPNQSETVKLHISSEDFEFIGPLDDRHYIHDPSMSFFVGIGAGTDCRATPEDSLCIKVEATEDNEAETTPAACKSACDLWLNHESHSCANQLGLSSFNECIQLCKESNDWAVDYVSVGVEGWGWNYVSCLESVVYGFEESSSVSCAKMTRLCRDIFATRQLNEFGLGTGTVQVPSTETALPQEPAVTSPATPVGSIPVVSATGESQIVSAQPSIAATSFALLSGVLGAAVIILAMRGRLTPKKRRHSISEEPPYPTIEMFSFALKNAANNNTEETEGNSSFSVFSSASELLERIEQHKRREFSSVPSA